MSSSDDRISSGTLLYALLPTVPIPASSLSSLLSSAYTRTPPTQGAALCVLTSLDPLLPTHKQGTSPSTYPDGIPTVPAEFAGKTVRELRKMFRESFGSEKGWAGNCFGALDERFVREGNLVLVSLGQEDEEQKEGTGEGEGKEEKSKDEGREDKGEENDEEEDSEEDDSEDEDEEEKGQMLNHRAEGAVCLELMLLWEEKGMGVHWHAEGSREWDMVVSVEAVDRMWRGR